VQKKKENDASSSALKFITFALLPMFPVERKSRSSKPSVAHVFSHFSPKKLPIYHKGMYFFSTGEKKGEDWLVPHSKALFLSSQPPQV
jgi:hypothetical protein